MKWRTRQSAPSELSECKLHPPSLWMRALFEQPVGTSLFISLVTKAPSFGELIYPHRFFRGRILDRDRDQILGK